MNKPRLSVATPVGLIVFGVAILALTPAAPGPLRRFELLAVHLYRPLSTGFEQLELRSLERAPETREEDRARIEAGIMQWNATLKAGAEQSAPGRDALIARVVDVDVSTRRMLIDAGSSAELSPGDAVLAGRVAVGLVEWAKNGVAIVKTPFTPGARFVGRVDAGPVSPGGPNGPAVRFVTRGVDWSDWVAAVVNPERERDLAAGLSVTVPDVSDLLPPTVPTLPTGVELGRLQENQLLAETGRQGFCLVPSIQFWQLDAVVVLPTRSPPAPSEEGEFRARPVETIACGLLSPWRDGVVVTGFGLRDSAAVIAAGVFVGAVDSQLMHAAKVRGVFDPGQTWQLLVITASGPYPIRVRAERRFRDGGRFEVLDGARVPEPGELLVTAGRRPHVPRALLVGRVVGIEGTSVDVLRPRPVPDQETEVTWREGFPADAWREAGLERGQ